VVTGASFPLASEKKVAVDLDFLMFAMVDVDIDVNVAACVIYRVDIFKRCCLLE
jgi:hypothetical protein